MKFTFEKELKREGDPVEASLRVLYLYQYSTNPKDKKEAASFLVEINKERGYEEALKTMSIYLGEECLEEIMRSKNHKYIYEHPTEEELKYALLYTFDRGYSVSYTLASLEFLFLRYERFRKIAIEYLIELNKKFGDTKTVNELKEKLKEQ